MSPVGGCVCALFLSLMVPSVLPTNLPKLLSSTGPEAFRRLDHRSFYGIQIPFLELMYRSAELSKKLLIFKHLSLESLFCFLNVLAHNK